MTAVEVLIKGDRKECADLFGVGLVIAPKDTTETITKKCNDYIARYEEQIKNIKEVLDNIDQVEKALKDAKIAAMARNWSPEQKADLLKYLQENLK